VSHAVVVDAVVLAGGRGSRLGGVDKPAIRVGGTTLLERALAAVRCARTTVVVGPPRATPLDDAVHVQEDPPFAGPAAAIGAGLAVLGRSPEPSPLTVVLAADLPGAVAAVQEVLAAIDPDREPAVDAWIATDPDGRRQYLLGAYRTRALVRACRHLVGARGSLVGAPVRQLLDPLPVVEVPLPAVLTADVDTPDDLARAVDREEHHDVLPTSAR